MREIRGSASLIQSILEEGELTSRGNEGDDENEDQRLEGVGKWIGIRMKHSTSRGARWAQNRLILHLPIAIILALTVILIK